MPPTEEARAGAGPYREARLSSPRPPSRSRWAAGLGGAFLALGALRAATAPRPVPAPASRAERALSLAGGARITAVFGAHGSGHSTVLRVPGEHRRTGDDTAAGPELLDGHGVVEAVPDGEHFLDVRSALFRVQDGALRPVPVAELGPFARTPEVSDQAWVVQRAGDFARMNDGALLALRTPSGTAPLRVYRGRVRDVATDGAVVCAITDDDRVVCAFTWAWARGHGPNAPDVSLRLPWGDVAPLAMHEAVQVVVADRVACVRGRRGEVFCARFELPASLGETMPSAEPMLLTEPTRGAAALAISRDDLCVLGVGGGLRCVHGPDEDAVYPLDETTLRLRDAMGDVTEVALTDGLGCARRGGRVACWGPLARSGWVVARDRPVRIEGLNFTGALIAHRRLVCSVMSGLSMCWGRGPGGNRHPRPVIAPVRVGHRLASYGRQLCDGDDPDALCHDDVGSEAPASPSSRAADDARDGVRASSHEVSSVWGRVSVVEVSGYQCAIKPDETVACRHAPNGGSAAPFDAPAVSGLAGIQQLVMTDDGLACARDRVGAVWCWHDNRSGALTAAEAERSPRVVTLRR
jgi:hypothetical protein